jgi:hypothetical protein
VVSECLDFIDIFVNGISERCLGLWSLLVAFFITDKDRDFLKSQLSRLGHFAKKLILDGWNAIWHVAVESPKTVGQLLGCIILAIYFAFFTLLMPIFGLSTIFCPIINGVCFTVPFSVFCMIVILWTSVCTYMFAHHMRVTIRSILFRNVQWG